MFDIRSLLLAGVVLLAACSGSPTTISQISSEESAAAPLAEATAPALDEDADARARPTSAAAPAATPSAVEMADPETSAQAWCRDIAPAIQGATDATVEARFNPALGLADAIEDLNLLYRQAANDRPAQLADAVADINAALDVLEPLFRPVEWDLDLIDRDLVDDEFSELNRASLVIDDFNVEVCGLEPAGQLPEDPEIELADNTLQEPRPTPDPVRPPTSLEIDIFLNDVPAATEADATCFLQYRYATLDGAEPVGALDRMLACGMTIDRLTELGLLRFVKTTSPGIPRTDAMIEVMVGQARLTGMTTGEAECHVGAYVGQTSGVLQPEMALEQLLGCGLTVARMEELGLPVGCPWRPNVCASNS